MFGLLCCLAWLEVLRCLLCWFTVCLLPVMELFVHGVGVVTEDEVVVMFGCDVVNGMVMRFSFYRQCSMSNG
ncbi:hypothetical protein P8452_39174 [Trifolium repens]|nr:hypothetical protein P8452_39174 [Trifolium repens]